MTTIVAATNRPLSVPAAVVSALPPSAICTAASTRGGQDRDHRHAQRLVARAPQRRGERRRLEQQQHAARPRLVGRGRGEQERQDDQREHAAVGVARHGSPASGRRRWRRAAPRCPPVAVTSPGAHGPTPGGGRGRRPTGGASAEPTTPWTSAEDGGRTIRYASTPTTGRISMPIAHSTFTPVLQSRRNRSTSVERPDEHPQDRDRGQHGLPSRCQGPARVRGGAPSVGLGPRRRQGCAPPNRRRARTAVRVVIPKR